MIEAARIQSVIELVDRLGQSFSSEGASADVLLRQYFQSRRYAGSKDRRAVSRLYYQIIRHWGGLVQVCGGPDARRMMLAAIYYLLNDEKAYIESLFSGQKHGPEALSPEEQEFLEKITAEGFREVLYPDWMEKSLKARFGDELDDAMRVFNDRAPVGLRANLLKGDRAAAQQQLAENQIETIPGQWASTSLILDEQIQLRDLGVYKQGLIEVQDEAAQLAVELADIQPGQQVMDYCAGAGGKTLAAAAFMQNKGQIYALDVSKPRLGELKPRAKRAGAHVVQTLLLGHSAAKREKQLEQHRNHMDRVLLDVPCSGSGTWRRNPESKWRLTPDKLSDYCEIQKELLAEAWAFVKPGGRLVYMTCSIFMEENEQQVFDFVTSNDDVNLLNYKNFIKGDCPESLSPVEGVLQLSPHKHNCDGFFVAILEKSA
ncbi:RsmB/NOP family class I SAM-dependent RNA methyltransferase [Emcibacter nanhaiensis]|uniref:RsmB/NOP family class I SAM-dependent RNA methyltransferase n=1 Tax=Emcibacter nanhaiensis TaxID=1505037 RepID=A0A501PQX1_9PROT|nr:RsmB/NOP family class I SAM-dependent RNA methyltransferase [Emcibacter nanhaiensis]TPD62930.1 RsmB/NOP family class I SAM-dependent RNA methyltransferase [Emcibacter nanhaiensis]